MGMRDELERGFKGKGEGRNEEERVMKGLPGVEKRRESVVRRMRKGSEIEKREEWDWQRGRKRDARTREETREQESVM